MHGSKFVAVMIGVLCLSCLALTAWMMHHSGILQGATQDGQWGLGMASIAVHACLAICGIAMIASRNFWIGLLCFFLMLGAAVCSAWQISSFLVNEAVSVSLEQDAARERENARNAALLEMAKERQKAQVDMAKGQLGWINSTIEEARGRRDRKDYMDRAGKLISDMGKIDLPVLPESKVTPPKVQTSPLAAWVAAKLGYDRMTVQASPLLLTVIMILLVELILWPVASWFWNRPSPAIQIGHVPPYTVPVQQLPSEAAQPAALAAGTEPKALPAPDPARPAPASEERAATPSNPPPPPRPRQPIPHSVQTLVDMGFPLVRPAGGLRPKEPPKDAARRFVTWAKAMGLDGTYSATELSTLYREFAEADHREPIAYNQLASALGTTRGIERKRPKDATTSVWIITPGKFRPKIQAPKEPETAAQDNAEEAESEPGRGGRIVIGPFPVSAGRPAVTRLTQLDRGDPEWLHRNAKAMRAWRIAMNRKQRGSRIARRVA